MILRRLATLLLAAALLVGWQSALEHPLEHLDEHGGFVHKSGDHHDSSNADGPLCDAIAAIAVAVGCAAAPAAFAAPEFAAAAETPSRARPNTLLAPSSRDPPQRL
ncbi:MAG: hypothetical protein WD775_05985 [Burkholderiales bacterium]